MRKEDIELLKREGWVVECESPFEIRHEDGGAFASGLAADYLLSSIKDETNYLFTFKDMKNSFYAGMNRGIQVAAMLLNKPIDDKIPTFNEFMQDYDN